MSRRGRSPKIVMPGERPGRRRSGKGRMSFPKKDVVFVKVHEGDPFNGVLLDLPLKEGGSVQVLMPPDQAKALAGQIFKCYLAVSGEKIDLLTSLGEQSP